MVRNTKGLWVSKGKVSYRVESEKESFVKKDRQITEERYK
jgi:hypothetical protein